MKSRPVPLSTAVGAVLALSFAGQSKADADGKEWMRLPKGTCERVDVNKRHNIICQTSQETRVPAHDPVAQNNQNTWHNAVMIPACDVGATKANVALVAVERCDCVPRRRPGPDRFPRRQDTCVEGERGAGRLCDG